MAEATDEMPDFLPFDSLARQRARARALGLLEGRDQLLAHVEAELAARAELLGPTPEGPALRIGLLRPLPAGEVGLDPSEAVAAARGGQSGDEDARHFPDGSFARITALMTLHGVNDLPGALLLARRALIPGGRLQAAFPAGFSAGAVREAFLDADIAAGGGVQPRVGPTVDPAEAAGLLQRAGFNDPVAEVESLTLRYLSLADFARDARAHGDTGWLSARGRGLTTPRRWALAEAAFRAGADADGRVPVAVQILYLSGRAG
jgi:SAM-dependent methyltransferase